MTASLAAELPAYVIDTHTLFWNLWEPDALVHDAVLLTKDAAIRESGLVPTVW